MAAAAPDMIDPPEERKKNSLLCVFGATWDILDLFNSRL